MRTAAPEPRGVTEDGELVDDDVAQIACLDAVTRSAIDLVVDPASRTAIRITAGGSNPEDTVVGRTIRVAGCPDTPLDVKD